MFKIPAKFVHNCNSCIHLETIFISGEWKDLYYCDRREGILISRYGNEESEYASTTISLWRRIRKSIAGRLDGDPQLLKNLWLSPDIEYAYQKTLSLKV